MPATQPPLKIAKLPFKMVGLSFNVNKQKEGVLAPLLAVKGIERFSWIVI